MSQNIGYFSLMSLSLIYIIVSRMYKDTWSGGIYYIHNTPSDTPLPAKLNVHSLEVVSRYCLKLVQITHNYLI